MTLTHHGLRYVRRVREVTLEDLGPQTKELMIRNHLFFEYAEAGSSKLIQGDWCFVANPDSGTTLKDFSSLLYTYLAGNTKGLYCKVRKGDIYRGKCTWDVYFEHESDLDEFVKNFLVLHKLSN